MCAKAADCVKGTTNVNIATQTSQPIATESLGIGGPLVTFSSTQGDLSTHTGDAVVCLTSGAFLTNLTFSIPTGFTDAEFNLEMVSTASFIVTLTDSARDFVSQTFTGLQGSNIFDVIAPIGSGIVYTSGTLFSTIGGSSRILSSFELFRPEWCRRSLNQALGL
jgi:hypothetical protein